VVKRRSEHCTAAFCSVDGNRGDTSPTAATTSGAPPTSVARQLPSAAEIDSDLAGIMTAWPDLPPHIRAAVLALIGMVPQP
jgi:hypothetical protein